MSNDVNLSISKEIVNPIIKEKVNQIVLEALGGSENLVTQLVDEIVCRKVDENGKINQYSSCNKYAWLDIIVTKQIKEAVEKELQEQIKTASSAIKETLIQQIRTKKGSSLVAKALMDGLEGTFRSKWTSKIAINISNND